MATPQPPDAGVYISNGQTYQEVRDLARTVDRIKLKLARSSTRPRTSAVTWPTTRRGFVRYAGDFAEGRRPGRPSHAVGAGPVADADARCLVRCRGRRDRPPRSPPLPPSTTPPSSGYGRDGGGFVRSRPGSIRLGNGLAMASWAAA